MDIEHIIASLRQQLHAAPVYPRLESLAVGVDVVGCVNREDGVLYCYLNGIHRGSGLGYRTLIQPGDFATALRDFVAMLEKGPSAAELASFAERAKEVDAWPDD